MFAPRPGVVLKLLLPTEGAPPPAAPNTLPAILKNIPALLGAAYIKGGGGAYPCIGVNRILSYISHCL